MVNLSHYRYTKLCFGLILLVLINRLSLSLNKNFLYFSSLSQISHYTSLSGRFDYALEESRESLAYFKYVEGNNKYSNIEWLAIECLTNQFMIYVYSGMHDKAEELYNRGTTILNEDKQYVWMNLFYQLIGYTP